MKKIKLLIVTLLVAIAFMIGQSTCYAKDKINVYIFRGEGCPHCEEAIEWFNNTLSEDEEYKDKYTLVQYEVWYDQSNSQLMQNVASELGTEASGVPFIVVGEEYFSGFSATASPEKIKSAINKAYNDENYQDVVAAVKKGKTIEKKKDDKDSNILPIVIVSAGAIVTVLLLVFFTKEK